MPGELKYVLWVGAKSKEHAFDMLSKADKGYVCLHYQRYHSVFLKWYEKPSDELLKSICN